MDLRNVLPRLQGKKYSVLLAALLLLTVLDPLLVELHFGRKVFDLLFCFALLATIFAVGQRKWPLVTALALGIPAMAATGSVYGFDSASPAGDVVVLMRHVVSMLFLGFTAGLILYDVLLGERINGDKICGTICVYLLIGLTWGTLYSLCDHVYEDAFSMDAALRNADEAAPGEPPVAVYMYYSFVTLSTLGYGDVTPLAAPVRTFAWLEAVVGQLYIAVLVARLVGLHIAQSGEP